VGAPPHRFLTVGMIAPMKLAPVAISILQYCLIIEIYNFWKSIYAGTPSNTHKLTGIQLIILCGYYAEHFFDLGVTFLLEFIVVCACLDIPSILL
jgi:hypothetical protein